MPSATTQTTDYSIRASLRHNLERKYRSSRATRIVDELGVAHGAARVDIAVVNGVIHGYELKSDLDTLNRLPAQMRLYNCVLDKVTLVVGRHHLVEAFNSVPEWWGVTVAKPSTSGKSVMLYSVRKAEQNRQQDPFAVAQLLWRNEALSILEDIGRAVGVRSKDREAIYGRLVDSISFSSLKRCVRDCLRARTDWRARVR